MKLGSAQSDTFANQSEVRQDGNLGPLLYSIFINEVGIILPRGCHSFYDDNGPYE